MWLVICAWNHGKYILKCCDWIVFMWVYSPCLKQNQTLRSKRNRKHRPRMRRAQKSPRTPGNDDSGGVFFFAWVTCEFYLCIFSCLRFSYISFPFVNLTCGQVFPCLHPFNICRAEKVLDVLSNLLEKKRKKEKKWGQDGAEQVYRSWRLGWKKTSIAVCEEGNMLIAIVL